MNSLRDQLLSACLTRYRGHFASGELANNKVHIEYIKNYPSLRELVLRGLGKIALSYKPEFVVGIPDGGTWLAENIAQRHGIDCVCLSKDELGIDFETEEDKEVCLRASCGVLIEDVIRKFTNTHKVLAIPEIGERVVAEVAVIDRELNIGRENPDIPVHALVREYIPPLLPDDSPLWEFTK